MNEQTQTLANLESSLDEALISVTKFEELLRHLNSQKAEDLESQTNQSDYLDFLATAIYSLNSAAHSYAHLKSKQLPQEFVKVKEYYNRVKQALKGEGQEKERHEQKEENKAVKETKISKEAVDRIIKRNI